MAAVAVRSSCRIRLVVACGGRSLEKDAVAVGFSRWRRNATASFSSVGRGPWGGRRCAPYLRKVNLAALLRALHDGYGGGRLVDAATGAEYVPTYEDKDSDWMLVGDGPFKSATEVGATAAGSGGADELLTAQS